jgi:hypothetical protein
MGPFDVVNEPTSAATEHSSAEPATALNRGHAPSAVIADNNGIRSRRGSFLLCRQSRRGEAFFMSHKTPDLQTCFEPFNLPGLPDDPEPTGTSPTLLEVHLVACATSAEEFVRDFHPYVQGDILILPAFPLLTIGDERRFRINLVDGGPPLLSGRIGAIERIGAVRSNGRPGWVRAQILGLDPAATELLGQLVFTHQFEGREGTPLSQSDLDRVSQLVLLASADTADIPSVDSAELQVIEDPRPPRENLRPLAPRRAQPARRLDPRARGQAVAPVAHPGNHQRLVAPLQPEAPPGPVGGPATFRIARRRHPAGTLAPLFATALVAALVGLIGGLVIMK